jgi:hypothetical protein
VQRHFPSTVTGPTQQFQRVRVSVDIEAGTMDIRDRRGRVLREVSGTITATNGGWSLSEPGGEWSVTRDKGCGCGGSKVLDL